MKKNTFSFYLLSFGLISILSATQSCNKGTTDQTEKKVNLIHGNMSFDIPLQSITGDNDSIVSFYYKMNMDSFVKSYGSQYDTSSIRNAKLTSCVLSILGSDTNNNFRNFHTTNIGITSGSNKYIYRIAAFTDIVDTNAYSINIPRSYDPNLASYFKSDSVRYRLYGNMRRPTSTDIKCTAQLNFELVLVK